MDIVSFKGRVWHAAGGTAGNVAAILGFLGWASSIATDLGTDLAGQRTRRDLQKANVDVGYVRLVPTVRTPRIVHEITGRGHRYLFRCPKCKTAFPTSRPLRTDRAKEIIEDAVAPAVFFFDRLNSGTITLAEHFASKGTFIVFEPSRPVRPDLTMRALQVANLIKFADDRETGLDHLKPANARQVWVMTCGSRGAKFRLGSGVWHTSAAFPFPVVDAGGAGDWTTAGLIHALELPKRCTVGSVSDALRWAQALAAVSCGAPGARGLSRTQSAEAVLQAAQFLEQRGERAASEDDVSVASASAAPGRLCSTCLQPTVASSAARVG